MARDPRKDAAYTVVPGLTAEEAFDKGYVVVEYAVDGASMTPIYGYYGDSDTQEALPAVVVPEAEAVVSAESEPATEASPGEAAPATGE